MNQESTSAAPSIAASLRDRFALAQLTEGGVLLDLSTGAIYTLNAAASAICAGLLRGERLETIEQELANQFHLAPPAAAQDIRSMVADLEAVSTAVPDRPAGDLRYFEPDSEGYRMRWETETLLRIDRSGSTVTHPTDFSQLSRDPATVLKWAVPYLLALQHQPVLHASAVQRGGGVLAFSGYTTAGKTTLARAFVAAGASPVSEDLLVVTLDQGAPVVRVDGERVLHAWAAENGALQSDSQPAAIDASRLSQAVGGATVPLQEIWLIDRARRSGDQIVLEPLPPAEALTALLGHGFAELQQREVWIELLEVTRAIVSSIPVRRATLPDGLDAVRAAIRAYSTTTAS